jgi:alkylation response protein AidB-like acyl-CoA dehydrogenase
MLSVISRAARPSARSLRDFPTRSLSTTMALGDDFPEVRQAVQRICDDFPGEYWREMDATREYPEAFVSALTKAGWLAALIPERYGGAGLPLRAASVVLETIHASGGSAAACHAQIYTMGTVLRHGSEAQKEQYLPRIASGELRLQAFGVSEPASGSDTTSLRTRARRDGDEYIVSGQKVWTSRAAHSDLMLLLARTADAERVSKPSAALSVFLIDLKAPAWRSIAQLVALPPLRCEALRDAMRCDAMRCDAMRCDAMRCDAMRCDAMRCDAARRRWWRRALWRSRRSTA